jgi:hypothetical protein
MNDIFNENNVSREASQTDFAIPGDYNVIRPISMSSIAMCQRIGNKTITAILNNQEISTADMNDFLTFVWMHVAEPELVVYCVSKYKTEPDILDNEVLLFGMYLTPDKCLELLRNINEDKQNIANSQIDIVPQKGSKKNLTEPPQE